MINQFASLIPGTGSLINELIERLSAGESFNNPKLTEVADRHFNGSRAKGTYTPRDAYDVMEIAVNRLLFESKAGELMQMSPTNALTNHLRPLMQRLPTQTDRIAEQTELQQFSTPPPLAYLAIWPRSIGARVICNEINPRRRALLIEELGFETFAVDAEIIDDLLPAEIQPTAVLMNPPFSAAGGRVVKALSS